MINLNLVKKKMDFSFYDNDCIDGNIAFCADSNYISYVGIAINSIIKNSTGKYCFHIFTKDIKIEELNKLERLANLSRQNIIVYEINDEIFLNLNLSKENGHVTSGAFYRFIVPDVLEENIKKIWYLDVDIYCVSNINSIFDTNINGSIAAVIADISEKDNSKRLKVKKYFNSGVMLINRTRWVKDKISNQCLKMAKEKKFPFLDQDILNIILENKTVFIDYKYNFQYSLSNLLDSVKKPSLAQIPDNDIIFMHFIGASKPWHSWVQNCRIVEKYNELKRNTEWHDLKLIEPKNYKNMHKAARVSKKEKKYINMLKYYCLYAIFKMKFILKGIME